MTNTTSHHHRSPHFSRTLLVLCGLTLIAPCFPVAHAFNSTAITVTGLDIPVTQGVPLTHDVVLDDAPGDIDLSGLEFQIKFSTNQHIPDHETVVEVAIVKVPEQCRGHAAGAQNSACEWSQLTGIGVPHKTRPIPNGYWYCCNKDARVDKACEADQYGKLITNPEVFKGEMHSITVTDAKTTLNAAGDGAFFYAEEAGEYAIVLANCHAQSRTVQVNGQILVESFEIKKEMSQASTFHLGLVVCYIALLVWFYKLMQVHKQTRTVLEEFIMATICFGFFEIALRAWEYHVWAYTGERAAGLAFVAMLIGACKHALGKCLLLMLSLGWGVVRASLKPRTLAAVLGLSITLFIATIWFDILIFYWSRHESPETGPHPIFMWLVRVQLVIEVVFMIWIPCALCSTIKYLQATNQGLKLQRYRTLLLIVVGGTVLTWVTLILIFTDTIEWLSIMNLTEMNQVIFFIILVFIAVVWKPNPQARDYAYSSLMDLTEGTESHEHHTNTDGSIHFGSASSGSAHHDGMMAASQNTMYMELTDPTPEVNTMMMMNSAAGGRPGQQQQQQMQLQPQPQQQQQYNPQQQLHQMA